MPESEKTTGLDKIVEKGEAAENMNVWALFDNLQKIEKMKMDELREEVKQWRDLWTYIPQEYQGLLCQLGQEIIVVERNYQPIHGYYQGPDIQIVSHNIQAIERMRDNVEKKWFIWKTNCKIPKSNIVDLKFVKGQFEDTPDPTY